MNIIEAIKISDNSPSGSLRVRRKNCDDEWTHLIKLRVGLASIRANDWEVEIKKVTITRDDLADTWDQFLGGRCLGIKPSEDSLTFRKLCEGLGL